jgi:transcriptional regulator with XRE-family HTH domain
MPVYAHYPHAKAIRDIRVREGVTLRELAEALEVSAVVLGEVERGASHLDTHDDYQVVVSTIKEIAASRGEAS